MTNAEIMAAGAAMRAKMDGENTLSTWRDGTLTVELYDKRFSIGSGVWRLVLHDADNPIPRATCDVWATAVSAPSVDWVHMSFGSHWVATWTETEVEHVR